MNDAWRLVLSFAVGGAWVAAATAVAERRGTRLGGFIGGLPSTLAVALLFMALTGGREVAAAAGAVGPLAFGVNALFVLVFVGLSRWGFYPAMGLALGVWALLQTGIVRLGSVPLWGAVAGWTVCFGVCYWGFERVLKIGSRPAGGPKAGPGGLLLRAVASGLLVVAAVAASQRWGAVAGGVLASLPVIFVSALFIAHRSMGMGFAHSMARSIVFSAVINCAAFAVFFHFAVLALPALPAFGVAYALTLLLAIPVYRLNLG